MFLAETLGAFGGMGTSGGLPFFCRPTDGRNFLAAGFGKEVYDRLWEAGGAGPEMVRDEHPEEIGGFIYNPEVLKRVYDGLAADAGVEFLFNTSRRADFSPYPQRCSSMRPATVIFAPWQGRSMRKAMKTD